MPFIEELNAERAQLTNEGARMFLNELTQLSKANLAFNELTHLEIERVNPLMRLIYIGRDLGNG